MRSTVQTTSCDHSVKGIGVMAGHRFCVYVVTAGSAALSGLAATAAADPGGGGSHGSASSHDSGKGHSRSGNGHRFTSEADAVFIAFFCRVLQKVLGTWRCRFGQQ